MRKGLSCKQQKNKMKKQMQKMMKGSQQSTLEEGVNGATAANPSRVNDTPVDESAIDADAVAKTKEGEGTAAADSRGRVNEDDADGMRSKRENVTDETIERKATATAARPPSKLTQSLEPKKMTAGETEASTAANTKTYERTTADLQWRRRSDANDARRRRANGEELVEYTMESASARAANEKEEISTESRHDKSEQRCEKDEEIKAHRRKENINKYD